MTLCRICNPEWLKRSLHDDDHDDASDEDLSPLDDDWIREEYRDAEDD